MKSLSILCQKGGVGKTTIVVNIAKIYSNNGIKTLIVDLDPQGNATTGLGKSNNNNEKNIYNLLIKKISFLNSKYRILLSKD